MKSLLDKFFPKEKFYIINPRDLSYSLLTTSYTKKLVRPRLLTQPNLLDPF